MKYRLVAIVLLIAVLPSFADSITFQTFARCRSRASWTGVESTASPWSERGPREHTFWDIVWADRNRSVFRHTQSSGFADNNWAVYRSVH
jgi:hypothetical protein